jgi:hypothetical protein
VADSEAARSLQQRALQDAPELYANLKALALKGGRGAGDRIRATLALLELAGVTTPASTSGSSPAGGELPPQDAAGGPGVKKYTLYRVDEQGIRQVHDALKKQAGGGDGR